MEAPRNGAPIPPRTASDAPAVRAKRKRTPNRPAIVAVESRSLRPFDVLESKLRIPELRTEVVSRAGLVNRLRSEGARVVTIVAAAGYGKTTLLAQWAARDERPFAWLSFDEHDNDALTLLRDLAVAFDAVEPVDPAIEEALASASPSVWTAAAPRLAAAFSSSSRPFVVVIDNVELLHRGEASEVVRALAKNVPEGSVLALAGRSAPPLGLARLRATGWLLELDTADLALGRREAQLLLRGVGARFDTDQITELVEKTEGWSAGLHLAALALDGRDGSSTVGGFQGADRYVSQYFSSEHLSLLTRKRLSFLRRTSLLDRMCGALCDATLLSSGSAHELEALERENLFVVPLDRNGGWYRYHTLFRDVLRRELERVEPELIPVLHSRAADWFESHGDSESALDHALAGRDSTRAARLLAEVAFPVYHDGRLDTLEGWLERFAAQASLDAYPDAAVLGGWVHALHGRAREAEQWLSAAERADPDSTLPDGTRVRPLIALLRAALCVRGVREMQRDVDGALVALPAESPWLPTALILSAAVSLLSGESEVADERFAAAAEAAERLGATDARVVAVAQRSLLAAAAGEHRAAEQLALEARDALVAGPVGGYVTSAIVRAAAARALLRHGRWDDARRELESAEHLARFLTHAIPWFSVETRLALASAYVTLRDRTAARHELDELEKVVALRPHLGVHREQIADLRSEIAELPDTRDGRSAGLTAAELRLLPLLATHLSFREIGERLFVSRNTIKTQAISAYRKLGVSSRSAAIERAAELGLVDDVAAETLDLTRTG